MEDIFFLVKDLESSVEGNKILKGINLSVNRGEIHAVMGPNGSGKTTLSNVIMGNPLYEFDSGDIIFKGESIVELPPDERAKRGIFMSFQHPEEVPGVSMINFLRLAYNAINSYRDSNFSQPKPIEFRKLVKSKMEILKMDDSFLSRYLNEGFSGGEKKRSEMLQMFLLEPELVIFDEIDSGLDVDALRIFSDAVSSLNDGKRSFIIITHYSRVLRYVKSDFVHVMVGGRIVKTGDYSLANEIEEKGYDWILKEVNV